MSKKLIGMFAGIALFGAGAAFAGEGHATKEEQAQTSESKPADSQDSQESRDLSTPADESGIGGSGSEGTASGTTSSSEGTGGAGMEADAQKPKAQEAQGEQELSGKVIKSMGNKLYVDHQGAIVELRTDSKTQFEGDVKRAKDLKEGDEIRASFTVKNKTQNQAVSISKSSGTGGSGFEDVGTSGSETLDNTGSGLEGSGEESGGGLEGGQGGSGSEGEGSGSLEGSGAIEGSTPDTMGTEPSDDLGTQTGSDTQGQPVDQSSSGDESGSQIQ